MADGACGECGARVRTLVTYRLDGRERTEEMTEGQIEALPVAPSRIERRRDHKRWCTAYQDLIRA